MNKLKKKLNLFILKPNNTISSLVDNNMMLCYMNECFKNLQYFKID